MEILMTSRHKMLALTALAATGLALGGCAGMPDQTQTASASRGCKIVLIDNTAQEISAYNSDMHGNKAYAQAGIEQNYADAKVGDAQNKDRRPLTGLQFHGTPNAMTDARRDC
jgi:hypothetical protein